MASTQSQLQVAVIDIEGMTCQHCAQSVQQALASTPGVSRASVDVARNEAHVTFDGSTVSIATLMQAVTRTGFTAVGFTRGPAGARD